MLRVSQESLAHFEVIHSRHIYPGGPVLLRSPLPIRFVTAKSWILYLRMQSPRNQGLTRTYCSSCRVVTPEKPPVVVIGPYITNGVAKRQGD